MAFMKLNMQNAEAEIVLPFAKTVTLLGASVGMGLVLMLVAIWANSRIARASDDPEDYDSVDEIIQNASNFLFMSVGMTAVMILVNNNLARAFAIGAAISLIRFRIKMDKRAVGTTLLFSVLTGMACGVGEIDVAAGVLVISTVLQVIVTLIVCNAMKRKRTLNEKAQMAIKALKLNDSLEKSETITKVSTNKTPESNIPQA